TWSRNPRDVLSNFFVGRFDGDRTWRGYYLVLLRGQIAFELETAVYSTHPAAPPANRWEAEDGVGVRTPTLRSFPFDGPLSFHYRRASGAGPAGSLYATRLAFPPWAPAVVFSPPVLYCFVKWLRRARAGAGAVFPMPPSPLYAGERAGVRGMTR